MEGILRNMEEDPFSGIKAFLIQQGTFWNAANDGPLIRDLPIEKYEWFKSGR